MSSEDLDNKLKIRRMIEDDLPSVKYLELVCGLSFWSIEDYRSLLNNKDYIPFVAQLSDKIIGFIVARLITICDNGLSFNEYENTYEIEVYNIAIDEKFRKNGIGRKLLDCCSDTENLQGKVIYQLDVRKSNEAAIGFYKKQGFVIKGIRRKFYNNPCEDALFMSLEKIIKHKNLI